MDLLKYITPHTQAIFWIPERDSTNEKQTRQTLDYCLDGMMDRFHYAQPDITQNSKHTIYFGQNFGSPFLVCELTHDENQNIEACKMVLNKINFPLNADFPLLILSHDANKNHLLKYLKKHYPHLKFLAPETELL